MIKSQLQVPYRKHHQLWSLPWPRQNNWQWRVTIAKLALCPTRSNTISDEMAINQGYCIVRELLRRDNYQRWRPVITSYLKGEDLWSIIESPEDPLGNGDQCGARNFRALHNIQISCEPDVCSQIAKVESAKTAWNILATLYGPTSQAHLDIERGKFPNFPLSQMFHQMILFYFN